MKALKKILEATFLVVAGAYLLGLAGWALWLMGSSLWIRWVVEDWTWF